ncbi:hypothetical protein M885DRAFT_504343 [Pelagophyceae sp. CCMP2097]|nr:hypothetical protein M885DRAFT_504343 [Pelagophyceae sp. CCMP2097]
MAGYSNPFAPGSVSTGVGLLPSSAINDKPLNWMKGSFADAAPSSEGSQSDEEGEVDAAPEGHSSSASLPGMRPDRRDALVALLKHLPSLASTLEVYTTKRAKLQTVKASGLLIKLENETADLAKTLHRCACDLAHLRASGRLGAPDGAGRAHEAVLAACAAVADHAADGLPKHVVDAFRGDVDAHVKVVRRALRRADAETVGRMRAPASAPRAEEPQRGSGFSEISRRPKPIRSASEKKPLYDLQVRDREYTDVMVLRKKDGLAIREPAAPLRGQQPRDQAKPNVSRHCGYVPSTQDLDNLRL